MSHSVILLAWTEHGATRLEIRGEVKRIHLAVRWPSVPCSRSETNKSIGGHAAAALLWKTSILTVAPWIISKKAMQLKQMEMSGRKDSSIAAWFSIA